MGVHQVVVPHLEAVATGRALIGCVDDHLLARTAAIGFCHVEMNYVLARFFRRLIVDVLQPNGMAQEEQGRAPVYGRDGRIHCATACKAGAYSHNDEYGECGDLIHRVTTTWPDRGAFPTPSEF